LYLDGVASAPRTYADVFEVEVYDRALSAAEVSIYYAGAHGKCSQ
jgi:hypothetical protein